MPVCRSCNTAPETGTFHKYLLPHAIYIILGAHILGAMKHHFVDRHLSALKRMVS